MVQTDKNTLTISLTNNNVIRPTDFDFETLHQNRNNLRQTITQSVQECNFLGTERITTIEHILTRIYEGGQRYLTEKGDDPLTILLRNPNKDYAKRVLLRGNLTSWGIAKHSEDKKEEEKMENKRFRMSQQIGFLQSWKRNAIRY